MVAISCVTNRCMCHRHAVRCLAKHVRQDRDAELKKMSCDPEQYVAGLNNCATLRKDLVAHSLTCDDSAAPAGRRKALPHFFRYLGPSCSSVCPMRLGQRRFMSCGSHETRVHYGLHQQD